MGHAQVPPTQPEARAEDATLLSLAKLLASAQELRCVVLKEVGELVDLVVGLTEWQTAVDAALRLPCRTPLPFDLGIVLALQKELGEIARVEDATKPHRGVAESAVLVLHLMGAPWCSRMPWDCLGCACAHVGFVQGYARVPLPGGTLFVLDRRGSHGGEPW